MKQTILTAFLFTLLASHAYAQALDKAKLDRFFDKLGEKNKAMGSVVIAKNGDVVYSRSIGFARITAGLNKPLNAATRFRIGSITKMFTAAMILQLIDEKKLKLTDTLDKFFPQIPNSTKITIAHLLAHRSGLHDSLVDKDLRLTSKTDAVTKDVLLEIILRGKPDFEPGSRHAYSNSGYAVLGLIMEKVSGRSYEESLKKRIVSKIGLKDTYAATGVVDISNGEALSYMRLGADWKQMPETHPSILFGSGSIVSTPSDMAKFIHALFDGKIVSAAAFELMKTVKDGDGSGMEPFVFAGKTFYGHTGGVDNYGAWLAYLPEEKLALAYATNAKVYPVKNILSGVADIYYSRPFEIPSLESVAVSPETLEKYVGVYSRPDAPVKFTITRVDSTLYFQPPGESAVPLEATAADKFQIEGAVVIEFDAATEQMKIKRRGGERTFTKEN